MKKFKTLILKTLAYTMLFGLILLSSVSAKRAEAKQGDWAFSLTTGTYKPSLRTLNRVLRSPNTAILQDPNFQLSPNGSRGSQHRSPRL